jgi:hypothetical protein
MTQPDLSHYFCRRAYNHKTQDYAVLEYGQARSGEGDTYLLALAVLQTRWRFPQLVGYGTRSGLLVPLPAN